MVLVVFKSKRIFFCLPPEPAICQEYLYHHKIRPNSTPDRIILIYLKDKPVITKAVETKKTKNILQYSLIYDLRPIIKSF